MKKISLLFGMFMFLFNNINAQSKLELTARGLVFADNPSQAFTVVEKTGTQEELYKFARNRLTSIFVSPKDVLSESEFDVITINGITKEIGAKKFLGYVDLSTNYTIVLRIKDGRIRIDVPTINRMTSSNRLQLTVSQNDNYDSYYERFYVFDKKGKLKNESGKHSIEQFFNVFLKTLLQTDDVEDW